MQFICPVARERRKGLLCWNKHCTRCIASSTETEVETQFTGHSFPSLLQRSANRTVQRFSENLWHEHSVFQLQCFSHHCVGVTDSSWDRKHRPLNFNGFFCNQCSYEEITMWALESALLVFLSHQVVQGSSLGNFTPNHPHQVLTMKQGNSPETATASRIRAELRQEENAGWGTWGGKPRQPQSTVGTWCSTTATSKPEMTATKRTEESNTPWQQVRGTAILSFLPTQGKISKKKIKKKQTNIGKHQSEQLQVNP